MSDESLQAYVIEILDYSQQMRHSLVAALSDAEKALALLSQALQLAPSLTEWSKKDSDLDSLRNLLAYQALYQP